MKVITLTRGAQAIVDDEDFEELSKYKWNFNGRYATRQSKMKGSEDGKQHPILMHRQIMCAPKGITVDHINCNKLDNRKCNLRFATMRQQNINQPKRTGARCLHKGVYWREPDGKKRKVGHWRVVVDKKETAPIETFEEAVALYRKLAEEKFGEFARFR